ncbi:MAG: NACHT domain-containing protein [Allosphingosinicella sp.]
MPKANRTTQAWRKFAAIKARHRLIGFISPKVMSTEFRSDNELIGYSQLKRLAKRQSLAIVSAAGTGKTTLLLKLLDDLCGHAELQPVFFPLADLSAGESFESFVSRNSPDGVAPSELAGPSFLLAWDGVNEAQRPDLADVINSIRAFHQESTTPYYISCRPDEYPPACTSADQSEIQIAPLDADKVQSTLRSLFAKEGHPFVLNDLEGLQRLSGLCQVPLFYGMVQTTISCARKDQKPEIIRRLLGAVNTTDVYREFTAQILVREESKSVHRGGPFPSAAMREFILGRLGFFMQEADLVYWEQGDFETAIRRTMQEDRFSELFPDLPARRWQTVIDRIRRGPPVQVIPAGRDENKVGFIHQSVGEYFASLRVAHAKRDGEDWQAKLFSLLDIPTRRNWPTAQFASGFKTLHVEIIEFITDLAMQRSRQDLLVLAARCVQGTSDEPTLIVEDLQVRMMEAFKNWGKPFDYDLVHALGELGRRGVRRPRTERIQRDIERFVAKYSEFHPVLLCHSPDHLLRLVETAEENEAACAAYSLGICSEPVPTEALHRLCRAFEVRTSWRVREQIMATLKERADPVTGDFVAAIVSAQPSPEATRTQVFALNALALMGDLTRTDVVIAYLRDTARPFRDSAAWSLQKLVLKAREQGRTDIVDKAKRIFLGILFGEDRTAEWAYLAGNILYTLGLLKASELSERLVEWGRNLDDAYVLEDLLYGLGLMGDAAHTAFIEGFVEHEDPAVRLKALEALGLIGATESRTSVRQCLDDEFPVVRLMAETVDKELEARGW